MYATLMWLKMLVPGGTFIFLLFCPVEVVCVSTCPHHKTIRRQSANNKKKGLKTRLAFLVFKENHL